MIREAHARDNSSCPEPRARALFHEKKPGGRASQEEISGAVLRHAILEQAYTQHSKEQDALKVDPAYDLLGDEPRLHQKLLAGAGLAP